MTFRIVGREPGDGAREAQRTLPASAAVVAIRWAENGIQQVAIETEGRRHDLAAFRKRFMLRKKGAGSV